MKDHKALIESQPEVVKPKKRNPARLLTNLIKSFVILTTIGLVIFSIAQIPDFFNFNIKLDQITIKGNQILTSQSILNWLELNSEIEWLDLDPFETTKRLVAHPWIEKAIVNRGVNQQMEIQIVETTPRFFLNTGKKIYLLNNEFEVLSLLQSGNGWDLPVIVDKTIPHVNTGDKLSASRFRKAIEIVKILDRNPTLPITLVSEIDITDRLNIELVTLPGGTRIKLGANGFIIKLANLAKVIPVLSKEGSNIRYIDLRYKNAVVYRRKV